ncbi:MAG: type VI secretion system ATPase TssH, partial [Clostridia bacterium]|nr:type VI secretion system ATPase TssH [Clostridia bacterium]
MNAQKFTQKSLEAVQRANDLAVSNQHMQIEQVHLLTALLQQEDGLIPQLMKKMGADGLAAAAEKAMNGLHRVTGSGREAGKIYVATDVDRVLTGAEQIADRMKDDYVSVEHLFLALLDHGNDTVKKLMQQYGVQRNGFLSALQTVRGNTRVTSDSPEGTYDVLKKYGQDLVELARSNKLDP